MLRRSYVQKVICSEGPMSDGLLFRRSYVRKVLSSESPVGLFRRSLFRRFYIATHCHLSVSGIETFFLSQFISRFFYFLHNFIIHFFLGYTRMSSEDLRSSPTSQILEIRMNPSPDVQKLRRHAYAFCAASFL